MSLLTSPYDCRVALAHEQLGRDREVAELRETPRHVGDVLVHTEDLRDHEHHRQLVGRRLAGGIARYAGN